MRSLVPDRWSGFAVLACMLPIAGTLRHSSFAYASELSALELVFALLTLPGIALFAYPQIAMALVVRRIRSPLAKAAGVIASTALGIWYAVWAFGADLSGNSTAGLALIFFQIMIQGWAWLAAFALVAVLEAWMRRSAAGRGSDSPEA